MSRRLSATPGPIQTGETSTISCAKNKTRLGSLGMTLISGEPLTCRAKSRVCATGPFSPAKPVRKRPEIFLLQTAATH
jgi:hypothetical protein